jgi:ABC-type multidrug transport system ATPase subunit
VIEVRGLTKRYGSTVAVDRLSFDVAPGAVTGFLGLNGSGKSTTMRMILGLDAPDAGHARIGGQAYRQLRWPLREAGGLLESRAFHPGRSARAHLAALAASNSISQSRVAEVLDIVSSPASSPAPPRRPRERRPPAIRPQPAPIPQAVLPCPPWLPGRPYGPRPRPGSRAR